MDGPGDLFLGVRLRPPQVTLLVRRLQLVETEAKTALASLGAVSMAAVGEMENKDRDYLLIAKLDGRYPFDEIMGALTYDDGGFCLELKSPEVKKDEKKLWATVVLNDPLRGFIDRVLSLGASPQFIKQQLLGKLVRKPSKKEANRLTELMGRFSPLKFHFNYSSLILTDNKGKASFEERRLGKILRQFMWLTDQDYEYNQRRAGLETMDKEIREELVREVEKYKEDLVKARVAPAPSAPEWEEPAEEEDPSVMFEETSTCGREEDKLIKTESKFDEARNPDISKLRGVPGRRDVQTRADQNQGREQAVLSDEGGPPGGLVMKALRQERHQTLKEKAEARQLDDQIFQPSLAVGEAMREAWSEHQSFDFIPEEEDLGAVVDMYDKARMELTRALVCKVKELTEDKELEVPREKVGEMLKLIIDHGEEKISLEDLKRAPRLLAEGKGVRRDESEEVIKEGGEVERESEAAVGASENNGEKEPAAGKDVRGDGEGEVQEMEGGSKLVPTPSTSVNRKEGVKMEAVTAIDASLWEDDARVTRTSELRSMVNWFWGGMGPKSGDTSKPITSTPLSTRPGVSGVKEKPGFRARLSPIQSDHLEDAETLNKSLGQLDAGAGRGQQYGGSAALDAERAKLKALGVANQQEAEPIYEEDPAVEDLLSGLDKINLADPEGGVYKPGRPLVKPKVNYTGKFKIGSRVRVPFFEVPGGKKIVGQVREVNMVTGEYRVLMDKREGFKLNSTVTAREDQMEELMDES